VNDGAPRVLSYTTPAATSITERLGDEGYVIEIPPKPLRHEILNMLAWVAPFLLLWSGAAVYFLYEQAQIAASLKIQPTFPTSYFIGFIGASVTYVGVPLLIAIALRHRVLIQLTRDDVTLTLCWRWRWQTRRQARESVKCVRHGWAGVIIEFKSNREWFHRRQLVIAVARRDRAWLASRLSELLSECQ
jgi:hypothetical protein